MIRSERKGDVLELRLDRPRAHALDAPLLEALRAALEDARRDPPRGVILTAEGSIFCAGLDLPGLIDEDRAGIERLLDALEGACLALFDFPRPVIAAIGGHAIAGGALLTVACDQRIMAEGQAKWGLTEAQLGLGVPTFGVEMARYAFTRRIAEKLLYGGALYPTYKLADMGVVDAVVEPAELMDRCRQGIEAWTASPTAFAAIKERLHAPVMQAVEAARAERSLWLDNWFSADTQAKLRAAVDALQAPRDDHEA